MAEKIRVRAALAVGPNGEWTFSGWGNKTGMADPEMAMDLACQEIPPGEARYWVEVEVEIPPEAPVLEATATLVQEDANAGT